MAFSAQCTRSRAAPVLSASHCSTVYAINLETVLSHVRDGDLGLSEGSTLLCCAPLIFFADHVAAVRGDGDTPDDAAISAQLEDVAEKAAAGAPALKSAEAETAAEVSAEEVATPADDLGLDFDLDAMMGDPLLAKTKPLPWEAAAAEIERTMEAQEASAVEVTAGSDEERSDRSVVDDAAPASKEHHGWQVAVKFLDGALANGSEPLLMLRELEELGALCLSTYASEIPMLDALDVEKVYLSWSFFVPAHIEKSSIEDVFDFIGDECELTIEALTAPMVRGEIKVEMPEVPVQIASAKAQLEAAIAVVPEAETVKNEPTANIIATLPAAPVVELPSTVAAATPAQARAVSTPGQTVRVDLAKLDKLIDTVGELVIAQAMMAQRLASHGLNSIDDGMLDLLTRDIQGKHDVDPCTAYRFSLPACRVSYANLRRIPESASSSL